MLFLFDNVSVFPVEVDLEDDEGVEADLDNATDYELEGLLLQFMETGYFEYEVDEFEDITEEVRSHQQVAQALGALPSVVSDDLW